MGTVLRYFFAGGIACDLRQKDSNQNGGKQNRCVERDPKFYVSPKRSANRAHEKGRGGIARKAQDALGIAFGDPSFLIRKSCTAYANGKSAEYSEQSRAASVGIQSQKPAERCAEPFDHGASKATQNDHFGDDHKGKKRGDYDLATHSYC